MNTKCCKAHSLKLIRIAYKQKKCTQSITICWLWAHTYQPNIGPTSIPHPTTYNKYTNQIIHSNQDLNHLIFLNMFHVPNVLHKNYQTTSRNSTFIIPIINQMHTKKIFWNFKQTTYLNVSSIQTIDILFTHMISQYNRSNQREDKWKSITQIL